MHANMLLAFSLESISWRSSYITKRHRLLKMFHRSVIIFQMQYQIILTSNFLPERQVCSQLNCLHPSHRNSSLHSGGDRSGASHHPTIEQLRNCQVTQLAQLFVTLCREQPGVGSNQNLLFLVRRERNKFLIHVWRLNYQYEKAGFLSKKRFANAMDFPVVQK